MSQLTLSERIAIVRGITRALFDACLPVETLFGAWPILTTPRTKRLPVLTSACRSGSSQFLRSPERNISRRRSTARGVSTNCGSTL